MAYFGMMPKKDFFKALMRTELHFLVGILLLFPYFLSAQFVKITDVSYTTALRDTRCLAWIDYDRDGYADIYQGIASANNVVFRNNAPPSGMSWFTQNPTGTSPLQVGGFTQGVCLADYDNDGDIDFLVGNNGSFMLIKATGGGTFSVVNAIETGAWISESINARSVAWVDYNKDGFVDIFATDNNISSANRLLRNNGDGTFTKITTAGVSDMSFTLARGQAWADYDNDGDMDLFVANNFLNNALYRNNGDGTFTKITSTPVANTSYFRPTFGGSWGDYDNDGDLDLFVHNVGTVNELYRNNGNGTFTEMTSAVVGSWIDIASESQSAAWADYDNDRDLDLFIVNNSEENELIINNGDGTFTRNNALNICTDGSNSFATTWADANRDGFLDLSFVNINATDFLYSNTPNSNNWISLRLEGARTSSYAYGSNRSAIGSRVRIKSNGTWQIREITPLSGYGSQESLEVEFGLGIATQIDSVQITWASGIKQYLTNLNSNQFLDIAEAIPLLTVNTLSVPAAEIIQGSQQIIYHFEMGITRNYTQLINLELGLSGTYQTTDFVNNSLKLWHSTTNDFSTATVLDTKAIPVGNATFTIATPQNLLENSSHYYWVTVEATSSATVGNTIQASLANADITLQQTYNEFSGTLSAAGIQTINTPLPVLNINSLTTTAQEVLQNTAKHPIYQAQIQASVNTTILQGVTFQLLGTYQTSDLVANSLKIWYGTENDLSKATLLGIPQAVVSSGQTVSFTGLTQTISAGQTGYFWLTVDVAAGAVFGNTLQANITSLNEIVFNRASKTGTLQIAGLQTFVTPLAVVSVNSLTISPRNVAQGTTKHPIYQAQFQPSISATILEGITFQVSGTYQLSDLVANSLRLWYGTENDLSKATALGSPQNPVLSGQNLIFTGLTQTISAGQTGYLWLTADIASQAIAGNTLQATITSLNEISLNRATKTGTLQVAGLQTFVLSSSSAATLTLSTQPVDTLQVAQNTQNHIVYAFQLQSEAGKNSTQLKTLTVQLQGNYQLADLQENGIKLWVATQNDFTKAQLLSALPPVASGERCIFSNLNTELISGNTYFFWITLDISPTAKAGNTLQINVLTPALAIELLNAILRGSWQAGQTHLIIEQNTNLVMPTLFTPNGDGNNDFFIVRLPNIKTLELQILDRFGNEVYQSNDAILMTTTGWDGGNQPSGVYAWLMRVTFENGKSSQLKGQVKLLR